MDNFQFDMTSQGTETLKKALIPMNAQSAIKVFIWKLVEECTDRYHSHGGVVVFAATEERAREIANAVPNCNIDVNEMPDEVRDVSGGDEAVFIFPNSGCC